MGLIDMKVRIGSVELPGPVGVASGTFGYGGEYESLLDLSKLGALYTKAITRTPRDGNAIPRIIETPAGILNSIGLANVGVERFISEKAPELARYGCPVIANVAGSTEEEYTTVVERLEEACDLLAGYEINVSCPNVKHGGLAFGTDPVQIERLTTALRKRTSRPLIIKLTPNVTDITVIARAAEAGGADALSCINTCVGMVIDTQKMKPVFAMKTGGLSGPAIRPIGVALTYRVCRAVTLPVIGMGGIMCGDDALQYLLAGASAVQVGTGTFVDPRLPNRVTGEIEQYCASRNISSLDDLRRCID